MQPIGIVTDSHSGITQKIAKTLGVKVLPMPFYVGEECCYEGLDDMDETSGAGSAGQVNASEERIPTMSRQEFFEKMAAGMEISTSQPSPASVMELWDEALKEYEQIVYIPISSGLSGSCSTAMMMAQEDDYQGRVHVVDNGRVSVLLYRSVLDALELIQKGYSAEEIKNKLEEFRAKMSIYIAVEDLTYLKKGGRISSAAASLGTILNIKPVLKFDVGTLDVYKKCRGMKKARIEMLLAMKNELENTFKEFHDRDDIYLVAASSADRETTDSWLAEIREFFPGKEVLYGDLPLGLCCHIGPGGLGIGCSCKII
ncbi:MAG: DegV family protein [Lachnospiraceae bacterium]|nr:DegV family protein [Lachnospiraceae bacterium]